MTAGLLGLAWNLALWFTIAVIVGFVLLALGHATTGSSGYER